MTPRTYRLASSPMVYAPGIIAWAINGAAFKRDRRRMVDIVAQTWGLPAADAGALVTKAAPYTIDGETVIFSVPA